MRYCIAPTERSVENGDEANTRRYRMKHPAGMDGPKFQARILLRSGAAQGDKSVRAWSGRTSGIRVYMEGFRVLPYGETSNDWLSLDKDAADRTSELLSSVKTALISLMAPPVELSSDDRPGLLHLPNKHYFGAVFLTQRNAPKLRMLVNREGFIPDEQYELLVRILRTGVDLTTRTRAIATASKRQNRRDLRAQLRQRAEISLRRSADSRRRTGRRPATRLSGSAIYQRG